MVRTTCDIIENKEVVEKLLEGSRKTAQTVSATFGPNGKNVALSMLYNLPHITKDGVTVANNINLLDPVENIACQAIKEAARKTASIAGDGTTSTTLLTHLIFSACVNHINQTGINPIDLKKRLTPFVQQFIEKLNNFKLGDCNTYESIYNIANISSNGDTEISTIVSDILHNIGKEAIITVYDSPSSKTIVNTTDGIKLDRTHIIPAFNPGKTVRHNNCRILVTDLDITSSHDGMKIVSLQEQTNSPLLIICNDLTGAALNIIAHVKATMNLPIEVIRAPFIADARTAAVHDLALATGATPIVKTQGWTISGINEQILGNSDSVEITNTDTSILGRHGDLNKIKEQIENYQRLINENIDGLKDNYAKRLAYFTSGASVIYVGGNNPIEIQEKKDRYDDTIRAVKAAMYEGYVKGATQTYHNVLSTFEDSDNKKIFEDVFNKLTEKLGVDLTVVSKDDKIVDPKLVISSSIFNAFSAASMLFTIDSVVVKNDPS